MLPYAIQKLPVDDDFKFNTHSDNYIVESGLQTNELKHFEPIAKNLNSMGISMAGLDVINGKVIEINVTSPCYVIKEVNKIFGVQLEKEICDYILTYSLLSL